MHWPVHRHSLCAAIQFSAMVAHALMGCVEGWVVACYRVPMRHCFETTREFSVCRCRYNFCECQRRSWRCYRFVRHAQPEIGVGGCTGKCAVRCCQKQYSHDSLCTMLLPCTCIGSGVCACAASGRVLNVWCGGTHMARCKQPQCVYLGPSA